MARNSTATGAKFELLHPSLEDKRRLAEWIFDVLQKRAAQFASWMLHNKAKKRMIERTIFFDALQNIIRKIQ